MLNSIAQVDSDTYLIAAQAKDEDGYLYTYDISPDGTSITKVAELEFDEYKARFNELYNLGSNSFSWLTQDRIKRLEPMAGPTPRSLPSQRMDQRSSKYITPKSQVTATVRSRYQSLMRTPI